MRTKIIFICLATIIAFSSCASMFTKSTYPVAINSTPEGAEVTITDKKGLVVFEGETPATVKLKSSAGYMSKAEYTVKLTLPGYKEETVFIYSSIEGWYFANILLGGLIGMLIVDPLTGAMWSLDTEHINIKMKPSKDTTLQIIDIKDVPEDMKKNLVRIN